MRSAPAFQLVMIPLEHEQGVVGHAFHQMLKTRLGPLPVLGLLDQHGVGGGKLRCAFRHPDLEFLLALAKHVLGAGAPPDFILRRPV